jgi:hypothetical protein
MGTIPRAKLVVRITVRDLLDLTQKFTPEVQRDPWLRSYNLGLMVAKLFLGLDWIEEHLIPAHGAKGFLKVDLSASDREVQYFRTIDLGEMLFNLQHIGGFDGYVARLRSGDVEPTLAELDVARMLYINDQLFWFVEPQNKIGHDYDFKVIFPGGIIGCVEAKCNLGTVQFNTATIKNSLQTARSQLPKDQPGIIFVKLPAQWMVHSDFARQTVSTALEFLRGTKRVVSVKYYINPYHFDGGNLAQGHFFNEIDNPNHRFEKTQNWELLSNWVPSGSGWNKMPRKYVRLAFFPLMEPPP